ncbi:MAG: D-alanine-D-alanine ligase [uncultured bacterium (gcode 4)]|uniref:D-alanine-D-alanine ligase n=1 Tax=uncultured bacterium (gcode 4) TaxID=1234023 RepID=K2F6C9_9BACT|nr:MAG: D-alanine-D-alanine ligase [uncultured bacterium (gcode 4)]
MQWAENKVKIPADISEKMTKVIQKMTKEIYESFKCEWWAPRVDYLYNKESEKIYVNEVNMIPWALQMHLWEKTWINGELFLETLIKTSIEKKEKRNVNIDFSSNIIDYTLTFINK